MKRAKQVRQYSRRQNWPTALALFVEEKRHQPFAWGVNDCCAFAADWVTILTGNDPARKFRGKYRDAAGAARVLRREGGIARLANRALRAMGGKEVPVALARRGDVLTVVLDSRTSLGVCLGAVSAFPGLAGVAFRPTADCRKAWRVG